LLACALPLLWNNERKYVRMDSLISKAKKMVVEVDHREPRQEDNFKLVHASGITVNHETITDADFGIAVENSVKLIRHVEMY
jgi:hypothetical protein